MHGMNQIGVIGMQESVYRDSPVGNLDTIRIWVRDMLPLQQGFDSDSQACLSISIDYLLAFDTFEQGIVGRMTLPNSTAVGTPFTCVPTINLLQSNIIIKAPLCQDKLEFIEWDSHDCSVESLAFGLESVEFLNGNVSIKPICDFDYLLDNLTKISLDEIGFIMFESSKLSISIMELKDSPASHYMLSLDPNMLSKIGLIKDFAIGIDNGNCEMLCVNVNSKHVRSWFNNLIFGKIGNNLQVRSQSECLASPTFCNKAIESLIIPILPYGNCNPISRIDTEFNKESSLCPKSLAVSWNIEFDSQFLDAITVSSPSISDNGANNLDIEMGVFLAV